MRLAAAIRSVERLRLDSDSCKRADSARGKMQKRAGKMPDGGAARPRRPRKATMKDVADLAGVSLATVSRALSASRRGVSASVAPGPGGGAAARLRGQHQCARAARQEQRPRRRAAARHRQSILFRAAARNRGAGAQPRHGGADRRHRRRPRHRRDLLATDATASAPTASSCSTVFFLSRRGSGRSPTIQLSSSASESPASTRRSSASTMSPPRSTRSAIWRASAIAASPTSAARPTTC